MNVVDSSAWIEYFGEGANAAEFAPAIEESERLIVPSLVLFEVFKRIALAMAEPIILATARMSGAMLWTQDAHFRGMPGVEFRSKAGA